MCSVYADIRTSWINWTMNILSDVLVFVLPFFLLPRIRINRAQKWGVTGAFLLGVITMAVSTARFVMMNVSDAVTTLCKTFSYRPLRIVVGYKLIVTYRYYHHCGINMRDHRRVSPFTSSALEYRENEYSSNHTINHRFDVQIFPLHGLVHIVNFPVETTSLAIVYFPRP